MSSFYLFFVIIVIWTSISSIEFGIHTPTEWDTDIDSSDSIVTLTLFWNNQKYQCNIYPKEEDVFYSCDTQDTTTTLQCDTSKPVNAIHGAIQIDNDDWDHVKADSVIIIGEAYHEIDHFCFGKQTNCDSTLNLDPSTSILIPFNNSNFEMTKRSLLSSDVQIQNRSTQCIPDGLACLNSTNNCTFLNQYKLIPLQKTWFNAQIYCRDVLNSSLATITNKNDLRIAVAIRDNSDYYTHSLWIGYTDSSIVSAENKFEWIDTTLCDYTSNSSYQHCRPFWGPSEPNNEQKRNNTRGEDCVEIKTQYTFGLFNDIDCDEKRIFFCNNPSFFRPMSTTNIPMSNVTELDSGDSHPKHFNQTEFIILVSIVGGSLILISVIFICCFFYYKRYIKSQIKKETVRQNQPVNDVQLQVTDTSKAVSNLLVQPGSTRNVYNPIRIQNNIIDDTSEEKEDMHQIVIIHSNKNKNMGIIAPIAVSSCVEGTEGYGETKLENVTTDNDSDDMYDNTLIIKEKNTPTVQDMEIPDYEMIENEEKIDEVSHLSDDNLNKMNVITVDGNTVGNKYEN